MIVQLSAMPVLWFVLTIVWFVPNNCQVVGSRGTSSFAVVI